MAVLNLTKNTTVEALRKEFNDAFGAQIKLYKGNKKAEMEDTLGDLGLTSEGEFECRSNLTVGSFIRRMAKNHGLRVRVYTSDEWVAVLDGLTLESAGKVKKNAVKADMESMIAYKHKSDTANSDEDEDEDVDVDEDVDDDDVDDDDDEWMDVEGDVVVDNISYDLWSDGTATANMFEDDDERDEITIVPSVKNEGKEYVVTSFAINDGEYTKLNLPSTIKRIEGGAFSEMDEDVRKNLTVKLSGNNNIVIENGVVYSADFKDLQNATLMPSTKRYQVRNGVEQIGNSAFEGHDEIEILDIPSSVKQIDSIFGEDSNLKVVNIHNIEGAVKFYEEEEGVESFPEGVEVKYLGLEKPQQPKNQINSVSDAFKNSMSDVKSGMKKSMSEIKESAKTTKKGCMPIILFIAIFTSIIAFLL